MNGSQPPEATIVPPASPVQFENQASNPLAKLEFPTSSMADGTPQELEAKAPGPKKARKKSAKSQNARAGSAGQSAPVDVDGEPAYRLSRVQKIVKMNDQAQISREAVFVMALAAEDITRRLTRAGCDAAKNAHRQEMTLSDVATAIQASTSLSFLSEVIPHTIPLSTARSRRLTKDTNPFPADPTQAMVSRVQDQLRHTSRAPPFTTHKTATTGGLSTPVVAMMAPGNAPVRNYSPREARAVANSKPGQGSSNGRNIPAPMPVGPMGTMIPAHAIPLPPGFDYRTLGVGMPPPPGMTFHHIDPDSYRNGIRWAPVQAGSEGSGNAQDGTMQLPPGMWTDGQFIMPGPPPQHGQPLPHMYNGLPSPAPLAPPPQPAPPSNSRSTRRASSTASKAAAAVATAQQQQHQTLAQPQSHPSPSSTTAAAVTPGPAMPTQSDRDAPSQASESTPGSPFHPGQLHGRTIYSADTTGGASSAEQPKESPKPNGRGPAASAAPATKKGKRTSMKGRGSALKKAWEDEDDAMDVNP